MPSEPVGRRAVLGGALGAATAVAVAACSGDAGGAGDRGGGSVASSTSTSASSSETTGPPVSAQPSESPTWSPDAASTTTSAPASASQIAARATVPVLCWHQLRQWEASDGAYARNLLICPPDIFRAQLDALADDGWNTIGPDQYLDHLTTGAQLPDKPVLLTFDDSQGSQMSVGLPELANRDMTATFFAMTVVLGKPGWLSRGDLRELDAEGMTVQAHTWDHHRVDEYSGKDWRVQLEQPRQLLEDLIGKPVEHFAYPFGAWDQEALDHVAETGYRTAYQLADRTPSDQRPLLTLRRELVVSTWSGPQLLDHLAGLTR